MTTHAPLPIPLSSTATNMSDALPALNFGFDDLRARMSAFTQQFDTFIERGRRRVLEERHQFRMEVKRVGDEQDAAEQHIGALRAQATSHNTLLSSHTAETAELQEAITALETTRDAHSSHLSATRARADACAKELLRRRETRRIAAARAANMAKQDVQECTTWENILGMRVEACGGTAGQERVRFVFVGCDDRTPEREAWFELDMNGRERAYEVAATKPRLKDEDGVRRWVERMCEGDELGAFLKGMRGLFIKEFSGGR